MINVKIGDINAYDDWGLILMSSEIGTPEVETVTITVPGRSGVLDCTEKLYGDAPVLKNRTIKLTFGTVDKISNETWSTLLTKVGDAWHGRVKKIIFEDDSKYYYEGRLTVTSFSVGTGIRTIEVTADCAPYKYLVADPAQKTL